MTVSAKKVMNKIAESVKKGFADIKLVLEEGNYKLFLKQLVILFLVFLGFRWCMARLDEQKQNAVGQIDAIQVQQQNKKEYLSNKKKLLDLEPRFPDISAKNDWLLRQAIVVFRDPQLDPKLGSTQNENTSNSAYTVVSLPITLQTSYNDFGKLVADIENQEDYLRISDFSLSKKPETLGANSINLNIYTIFPKEKIAPSLFKEAKGGKK